MLVLAAAQFVMVLDSTVMNVSIAQIVNMVLLMALLFASTVGEAMAGAPLLEGLRQVQALSQLSVFLSSVLGYSIGIFFNAALAICVLRKLEGKPTTIGEGMKEALTCLPQIVGWALLSSTIGLLLRMIERRSGFIGRLVANVLGVAWSVAAFLVVPVLVAERKGPVSALQESVQLLRRTWGENILAGIGFGGLYFLLCIPGMLVFVIGAAMIPTHLIFAVVVMLSAILYFPLLGLVLSTLSTIFDVVLYRYAKWGTITPGFDCQLLIESFVTKPV